MCVPDKNFDEFIKLIKPISEELNTVSVFTSVEATHQRAEYIRYGLNYEQFWNNAVRWLTIRDGSRRVRVASDKLQYRSGEIPILQPFC